MTGPVRIAGPGTDPAEVVATLRRAGCVFAEEEAGLLLAAAADVTELAALVARRVAGEPLEQVLGWAEFCGLRIAVEPGVFVPRQRTEHLVREAARRLQAGGVVVDLCCGSGAVGAALLALLAVTSVTSGTSGAPTAAVTLYAADIDPAAVRCARRNLAGLGEVFQGDLYAALPPSLRGRVQVLVVNAPYVPTDAIALMPPEAREHEPRAALDGGPDGVDVHRQVAAGARDVLLSGGHLLVETGERQAPLTVRAFEDAGLATEVSHSEELDATVVIGTSPGARQD